MKSIIFANGKLTARKMAVELAGESDLIIAADGGIVHCLELNITPHILIGDLDSTPAGLIEQFAGTGMEIIRHPEAKDKTDLELALDLARVKGARETYLFAALGNRWDMSLANLFLLAAPAYADMQISIIDDLNIIYLLKNGDIKEITVDNGSRVSLIPMQNDIQVSLQGFKYPLASGRIAFASTRGISNYLTADRGIIIVENGMLFCVQNKKTA